MLSHARAAVRWARTRSVVARHLRYVRRFPGLGVEPTANFLVFGSIKYGERSGIGEGTNIVVPAGAMLRIGSDCYIGRHVELGPDSKIDIGDRASIQDRCILLGNVSLGRYCVLAQDIDMSSGNHHFDLAPHLLIRDQDALAATMPVLPGTNRTIEIGEDCWIGVHAVVMAGVRIGRGTIIGANAIVTRDLPPYVVAAGSPARILRKRLSFEPPISIDWHEEKHTPYFYSGFQISRDERQANRELGGLLATGDFGLWLATGPTGQMVVTIRSAGGGQIEVATGGARSRIGGDWQEIRLPQSPPDCATRFVVTGGPVVVRKARTA